MCLKPFAFVISLLSATPAWADELIVFAAASLKGPLDAVAAEMPGVRVSYAGSGTLARQVQQGAPADVVLLAHRDWMQALVQSGDVGPPVPFAGNRLVLVGQSDAPAVALEGPAVLAALDGGRLAMGFTASVPAGIYGMQALSRLGLWDDLRGSVAEVDNVRSALQLVARGEAPLGVVYASDALVVPELQVVAVFPEDSHDPIQYWAAGVKASVHPEVSGFIVALQAETAQALFAAAGFCGAEPPCDAP